MPTTYVYLKNLSGETIKPVTDLSAVNLTTANGVLVDGNTIGVENGYVASCAYEAFTDPATAANPDSAFIEGGTMYTLLGGYTVSNDVPSANPSPYKVPSEYAVREAIDAVIATGGSTVTPGLGITTVGGSISVVAGDGIIAENAVDGGVSVKASTVGGLVVDAEGVAVNAGDGIAVDANNKLGVTAKASGGLVVDNNGVAVLGGTTMDLTGGTVNVARADVGEVLTNVVTGGTAADDYEAVTPDNLRGALSVGQAVDVSCAPLVYSGSITYEPDFFGKIIMTYQTNSATTVAFGFYGASNKFPKWADGLKYLYICDIKITSGEYAWISKLGTPVGDTTHKLVEGENYRIAGVQTANTNYGFTWSTRAGVSFIFEITNWRQYEVTSLTDEAIAYLAQLPNPDDFFRSSTVSPVLGKYLVKQDMVAPWIPTIDMPDNSDLTVGAGLSYKIKYTNDNAHKITVDTIPQDAYGWDSHIQMFVKGTAAIQFQQPLVLMNPLTPNAGHNLIVKYRNGQALVYVDDTDAGYVISVTSGTASGSLYDGLTYTDASETGDRYLLFSVSTDGQVCDAGTVTVNQNTDITGNGTDKTSITGNISVANGKVVSMQDLSISGAAFALNGTYDIGLKMNNVVISGNNTSYNLRMVWNNVHMVAGSTLAIDDTRNGFSSTISVQGDVIIDGVMTTDKQYPRSLLIDVEGVTVSGSGTIMRACSDRGFTLTVANITGSVSDQSGSAILLFGNNYQGNRAVTVKGTKIYNNTHRNNGIATVHMDGYYRGRLVLDGCEIYGNTAGWFPGVSVGSGSTVTIKDCYIHDNVQTNSPGSPYSVVANGADAVAWLTGSTIGASQVIMLRTAGSTLGLSGYNVIQGTIDCGNKANTIIISTDATLDLSGNTNTTLSPYNTSTDVFIGDNFTLKRNDGITATIDACRCRSVSVTAPIWDVRGILITGSTADPWRAINFRFVSNLDAHEANTISISGTTFTGATSITRSPARIQLPSGSTNSLQGNTNADGTKILQAPVMMVSDDPASGPNGSATVVNAAGTAITVSGIGTYIAKDGSNDFTDPSTDMFIVSAATGTGDGTLQGALTGTKRWGRLDNNLTASATFTADTAVVNKRLITREYEPILGGTFTVGSGATLAVDEANKTASISGGAVKLVDTDIANGATVAVSGGGLAIEKVTGAGSDSILNLGGTVINAPLNSIIDGVTITGASDSYTYDSNKPSTIRNCTISGNISTGSVIVGTWGDTLNVISCEITENSAGANSGVFLFTTGSTLNIVSSYVHDNAHAYAYGDGVLINNGKATINIEGSTVPGVYQNAGSSGSIVNLSGTNMITHTIGASLSFPMTVNLSSGAIIDLTGNTNTTPINPGGGVIVDGGCTVITSAGSTVSIAGGTYSKIKNDGTTE